MYSLYLTNRNEWRLQQKFLEDEEELINKKTKRESLFPILYPGIWEFYKKHLATHWVAEEIDYSKDKTDWENLDENSRNYIKKGLAFFASSDFIVNESGEKDASEAFPHEYKFFISDKMARENIHSETYALLLNEYVKNDEERKRLQHSVLLDDTIKRKAEWFREYVENGTFAERILAEAIMEGIFFSGTFASIFWLKKRGLMPSLCDSNEFISRDEGLHAEFNVYIYKHHIKNKLEDDIVLHMVKEAVEIEEKFIRESLPVSLIGMNADLMCKYIRFVADRLINNLIGRKYYKDENPFEWMSMISMNVKTDFFSHRPTTYGDSKVLVSEEENKIRADDWSF